MTSFHRLLALLFLGLPLLIACTRYNDEEHEKNLLNGLLVQEKYEDLEKTLSKAEQLYRKYKLTPRQWEGRWMSLANINADGVLPRFDAWVARTDSGYAHLARGMYLQTQAWEARGNKLAAQTSATQFAEFRRLADSAEEDLLAAHQKLSACALCSAERIRINRALGQPLRDSEYLLDEALLADPGAPSAVFQYFAHLYPQWGGSFEQMRAFIDHIQSRVNDPAILAELESRFCWEQARAAESRRDNKSAFAWYERGVTAHPYDMLMKNLAEAYTERGEYRKAVDILERNLQVNDPWDLYTIEALAQAYFRSDQQKQGEAMMQKRDEAQERYNHFR